MKKLTDKERKKRKLKANKAYRSKVKGTKQEELNLYNSKRSTARLFVKDLANMQDLLELNNLINQRKQLLKQKQQNN